MLRFLPILMSIEISPLENSMKYFLIQRIGSIIFILSALILSFNYMTIIELLIVISLLIKLGAAPFHGWFVSLAKTININTIFILSTIQKVIPLIILRVINYWASIIIAISIIRFLFILVRGITLLRFIKILALSRINNLV